MAFTVEDFRDLIRLIQEHPEWRDELRRWVLTDELLSLPAVVRELGQRVDLLAQQVMELALAQQRTERQIGALAETQRGTEERLDDLALRIDALAEAQARTEDRIRDLAEAQARTEDRIRDLAEAQARTEDRIRDLAEAQVRMESAIRELTEAQSRTEEALQGVILRVDELRGEMLEIRYRERAYAYFSKLIRRAHVLSSEELYRLIDQAIAEGQLTEEEGDELVQADAIIRGVWREDKQGVYLVVEVSWGIGMNDVERARRRAELLTRTGVRAIPVVAGKWISPEAYQQAKAFQVWQVRDGMVTAP